MRYFISTIISCWACKQHCGHSKNNTIYVGINNKQNYLLKIMICCLFFWHGMSMDCYLCVGHTEYILQKFLHAWLDRSRISTSSYGTGLYITSSLHTDLEGDSLPHYSYISITYHWINCLYRYVFYCARSDYILRT